MILHQDTIKDKPPSTFATPSSSQPPIEPPEEDSQDTFSPIIKKSTLLETCSQFTKLSTRIIYIISSFMFNIKTQILVNDIKMDLAFSGTTFEEMIPIYYNIEHGGFHVVLLNLVEASKVNPIFGYIFQVISNKYNLQFNTLKLVHLLNNIQETENAISYKSQDLISIKNDILQINGLEYNIKNNTLTIHDSFDLYNLIDELLNRNIVIFEPMNKCITRKDDKIIFYFDNINEININTQDEYLPKFIIDIYKENEIQLIPGIDMKADSMEIIHKLHELIISKDTKPEQTKALLTDGIMSTIFKKLGCGFTGSMSKITFKKMNAEDINSQNSNLLSKS